MATCIARELLNEGNVVVYRTASQLMDDIKEIRFKDNKAVEGFTHQREETVILKPAQVMVIDFNLDKGGIVLL